MKKPADQNRYIYWAVDPEHLYDDNSEILLMLRDWSDCLLCQIQPIFVFSEEALKHIPADLDTIMSQLSRLLTADFNKPDFIVVRGSSRRKMAYHLARYLEAKDVAYVFIKSRNVKKGSWSPFALGGFTEAFLSFTLIPTVVLNPKARIGRIGNAIQFPTDFKRNSVSALREIVKIAEKSKSKVYIFNHSAGEIVNSEAYHGNRVVLYLKKLGIEAEFQRFSNEFSLTEAIVKYSKEKDCGLIVIGSRPLTVPKSLIGSTVKNLVTQAHCPVMVVNSKMIERDLG